MESSAKDRIRNGSIYQKLGQTAVLIVIASRFSSALGSAYCLSVCALKLEGLDQLKEIEQKFL